MQVILYVFDVSYSKKKFEFEFEKNEGWLWFDLSCGMLSLFVEHIEAEKKMDTISQTTLSKVFSWMKIYEFWLKFHWSLILSM